MRLTGPAAGQSARRAASPPNEYFRAIYRAAGGDHTADARHRVRRHAWLFEIAGFAAAAGRLSDHLGQRATLPGASPNTVATSVAEPLERHLGQIADVTEMTSQSSIGQTRITLQFDVNRDIDGAARDVEAAINAARADLPSNLPSNPTYRKVNPADAPILILALTSKTMTQGQMYDAASNILAQRLAQLNGIGNVIIGGSTLPAVRVELNPQALYKYGIGLEDVRAALASANANSPKGTIDDGDRRYQIYTNDQANVAADYAPLVIAYRNGAAVRLSRRRRGAGTPFRTCAISACPTASLRSWSSCTASRTPTSSRPSIT